MATEAKIILKAQNNMSKELNSAKSDLKGLSSVADSLGINLSKLTKIGAITAALTALKKGVEACTNEFKDNELAYARLQASFNKTDYSRVLDTIAELSKVSLSSQTEITALAGKIASLGNSASDVEKITTATVNWANVSGQDLNSALGNVMDTLNGSVGEMGKYLPALKELTAEELKAGQGIELINNNLSKYSNNVNAGTFNQTTKNIADSISTIKSSLGSMMIEMAGPWLNVVDSFLTKVASVIEGIANLASSMGDTIEGPAVKVNFTTEQLQQQAMDLAKGYSEGKLSASALNYALASYNDTDREQVLRAFEDLSKVLSNGVPVDIGVDGNAIREYLWSESDKYTFSSYEERQEMENFRRSLMNAGKGLQEIVSNFDSTKIAEYTNVNLSSSDKIATEIVSYNKNSQILDEQRNEYKSLTESLAVVTGSFVTEIEKATDSLNLLSDYKTRIEKQISEVTTLKETGVMSSTEADTTIASLTRNLELVNRGIESTSSKIDELSKTDSKYDIVKNNTSSLISSISSITSGYKTEVETLNDTLSSYTSYQSQIGTLITEIQTLVSSGAIESDDGNTLITALNQQSDLIGKAIDDVNLKIDEATNPAKVLTAKTAEIISNVSNMADSYKTQEERLKDTLDTLTLAKSTLEEQIDKVTSAIESGNLSVDEGNAQLLELGSNLTLIERGIENTNNYIKELPYKNGGDISYTSSFESFIESLTDIEGNAFEKLENIFKEDSSLLNLNSVLSNSFSQLAGALQPLLTLITSGNIVFATLIYIFKGFANTLAPMISRVIIPLSNALEEIGAVIARWFKPVFDALYPIIKTITDMLMAVLVPTLQIINPFMELFARLLLLVKDPLTVLANAFTVLGETVSWLSDCISWVIGSLLNWLYSIEVFGWRPFGGVGYREVKDPGNLFERVQNSLDKLNDQINYDFSNAVEGMGQIASTSTETAVSNATYTGGSTIHINIYQQSPVVGEDGMSEFAKMIRREFVELGYYNI